MQDPVEIVEFTDEKMREFLPSFTRLRIEIFSDYPYLYDGDEISERKYLEKFNEMENALALGVFDQSELVGEATAYPLIYEHESLSKSFLDHDRSLEDYFCIGEIILKKDYRSQGLGGRLCEKLEAFARSKGFQSLCFFEIDRGPDDPKRPEGYRKLDTYWGGHGYQKHPELNGLVPYKEKGESEESPKKMVFWIKKLAS